MSKANNLRLLIAIAASGAALGLGSAASTAKAAAPASAIQLVGAHALYRWQARPSMRIPLGAAFTVHVPHGTTDADLYERVLACQSQRPSAYPFCVAGSHIDVHRSGAAYVIEVTSAERPLAMDIQHRAEAVAAHKG
jgi:hypothetical protein